MPRVMLTELVVLTTLIAAALASWSIAALELRGLI